MTRAASPRIANPWEFPSVAGLLLHHPVSDNWEAAQGANGLVRLPALYLKRVPARKALSSTSPHFWDPMQWQRGGTWQRLRSACYGILMEQMESVLNCESGVHSGKITIGKKELIFRACMPSGLFAGEYFWKVILDAKGKLQRGLWLMDKMHCALWCC